MGVHPFHELEISRHPGPDYMQATGRTPSVDEGMWETGMRACRDAWYVELSDFK